MKWFRDGRTAVNFNSIAALSIEKNISNSFTVYAEMLSGERVCILFAQNYSDATRAIKNFLLFFGGKNMIINPNDIASDTFQGNKPCSGKKSIKMEKLVELFPEITINGFQFLSNNEGDFPAFTFEESDQFFFYVSPFMLKKYLINLIHACGFQKDWADEKAIEHWDKFMSAVKDDGAEEDLNNSLQTFPVKIKIQLGKNKKGAKLYNVFFQNDKFSTEEKNFSNEKSAFQRQVENNARADDAADDSDLPF